MLAVDCFLESDSILTVPSMSVTQATTRKTKQLIGKLKPKIRGALVLALGISAPVPDPSAAAIEIKFLSWIINVHVER